MAECTANERAFIDAFFATPRNSGIMVEARQAYRAMRAAQDAYGKVNRVLQVALGNDSFEDEWAEEWGSEHG